MSTDTVTWTIYKTKIRLLRRLSDDIWLVEPIARGGVVMCSEKDIRFFQVDNEED